MVQDPSPVRPGGTARPRRLSLAGIVAVAVLACAPPALEAKPKVRESWPARTAALGDLAARFDAGHPDKIVVPGREGVPAVVVANTGTAAGQARVHVEVESFDGPPAGGEQSVEVAAGDSVRVPMPKDAFARRGIKWVRFRLEGGGARSATAHGSFAYMAPAAPRTKPPSPRTPAAGEILFGLAYGASPDNYSETAARKTAALGVDIARIPIYWRRCERRDGQWDWSHADGAVAAYARRGVDAFGLIMSTPDWAKAHGPKSDQHFPRLDAWRDYIAHLARHFRGRIRYWEVWNEPDIGFFHGTTDEYCLMLRAAYEEFKEVDPSMQVMTGGFVSMIHDDRKEGNVRRNRKQDIIEAVIRREHAHFDLLAYHTHGVFEGHFEDEIDDRLLPYMRKTLARPKPIFWTETGMDCRRGERHQAATLAKKVVFAWARGAVAYTWFNLHDMVRAEHPRQAGQTYGLYTPYRRKDPKGGWGPGNIDYSVAWPKASYVAYRTLIAVLDGTQYAKQFDVGEGRYLFLFRDGNRYVLVGWREGRADGPSPRLLTGRAKATRVDLMGNRSALRSSNGTLDVPVSETPAYIVLQGAQAPPTLERKG